MYKSFVLHQLTAPIAITDDGLSHQLEPANMDTSGPRPTTIEDRAIIDALLAASYPALMRAVYPDHILQPALRLMTQANPNLLSSGTFYAIESGNDFAVGCGGWTFGRPGTGEVKPGLAHIRHFATHPDWTGQQIGRKIYEKFEIEARLSGAKRFECYSSLNAEGFYASLGFTAVEGFDVPMGPNLPMPSVRMNRSI